MQLEEQPKVPSWFLRLLLSGEDSTALLPGDGPAALLTHCGELASGRAGPSLGGWGTFSSY